VKSILDPTFKYTPSVKTDIAKTFARIRRETARAAIMPADTNVVGMNPTQRFRTRSS